MDLCFPIPTAWMVQSQLLGPRSNSSKRTWQVDGIRRMYSAPTRLMLCAEASRTGALARRTRKRTERMSSKLVWAGITRRERGNPARFVLHDRGSRGKMQVTCGRSLIRDLGQIKERHVRLDGGFEETLNRDSSRSWINYLPRYVDFN